MPNRMIREGLLDSDRYWGCTIEARELFTHLMLLADDFGCVNMSQALIGRRCFDQRPTSEKLARLVTQLCDADLIRLYQSGVGTYAFIPRFGQRLRRFTLKFPRPPLEVIGDDKRALKLFNEINENNQTMSDGEQTRDGHTAAEEKRREENRKELEGKTGQKPIQKPVETIQGKTYAQWITDLGIQLQPQWTSADAKLAVEQALAAIKANP
jgi:hypothetical protein